MKNFIVVLFLFTSIQANADLTCETDAHGSMVCGDSVGSEIDGDSVGSEIGGGTTKDPAPETPSDDGKSSSAESLKIKKKKNRRMLKAR